MSRLSELLSQNSTTCPVKFKVIVNQIILLIAVVTVFCRLKHNVLFLNQNDRQMYATTEWCGRVSGLQRLHYKDFVVNFSVNSGCQKPWAP